MESARPPVPAIRRSAAKSRALAYDLAALFLGLLVPSLIDAQQAKLSDQQIRTAYVLNFIRYTDWPDRAFAGSDANIVLCTFGGDPGAPGLAGIAGKQVRGRTITLRSVAGADDARGCNVLFVREPEARRFVGTLRALQHQPVLTISEADAFIDAGGMIGLVQLDDRLQFEINLTAIQQAQLKANLQLLRLARNVIEARPR